MILQKQSNVVRWAYLGRGRPHRTSLCALFWNAVLITPVLCSILLFISPIALPVLGVRYVWVTYLRKPFRTWLLQREDAALERWEKRYFAKQNKPKQPSAFKVLFLGAKAIKNKVCPIVDFE